MYVLIRRLFEYNDENYYDVGGEFDGTVAFMSDDLDEVVTTYYQKMFKFYKNLIPNGFFAEYGDDTVSEFLNCLNRERDEFDYSAPFPTDVTVGDVVNFIEAQIIPIYSVAQLVKTKSNYNGYDVNYKRVITDVSYCHPSLKQTLQILEGQRFLDVAKELEL